MAMCWSDYKVLYIWFLKKNKNRKILRQFTVKYPINMNDYTPVHCSEGQKKEEKKNKEKKRKKLVVLT